MPSSKKQKNSSNSLKTALNLKWLFLGAVIFSIFLDTRCASIQQPTGGPKDSIPPSVVNERPKNLTRNFKEKEIVITFDEFVKLQNDYKEISISPDMDKRPIFKVRKRNLHITLPDSIEENTTYTINFGKGLVDYNESNPILNYSYVFATGNEIDSLNISGTVTDANTLEKLKEVTVMLIPKSQDSIFGKKKANIFTLTDTVGRFQLKNLKEQEYNIYALKEENSDRIYNGPNEEIGFLDTTIYLNKDTSGIALFISKGIPKKLRVMDRKIEKNGKILYALNKSLQNPTIRILVPEELNEDKIVNFNRQRDTASMWLSRMDFDSLKVVIEENGKALDTNIIRRSKNDKYERDLILTNNLNSRKVDRINQITIEASAPINTVDNNAIVLTEDSIARPNFQITKDGTNNRKIKLTYRWRAKRNYVLEIKEGAIQGFFDEKNKETKADFTLDETENFGDIILNITVPDSSSTQYLVQLMNDKKERIIASDTLTANRKINYRQYPGGKYIVRIVQDRNRNGQWDPGDVYDKVQPEKVWFMDKTITIRPNWEQEEAVAIPKTLSLDN
ncbi:Ig-like domain-containing domain [Olivibacter sitiensis]|uniref:Ig-like domain-containing domain n=1 Tax=Olivibacter sitiensis TaxID=376470 RepID=UPI000684135E|nr:Ig-like domain-containing domain [Olivibacter sitiensis]